MFKYSIATAALAAIVTGTATATEPHPFIGNWSGVWPNGQHNEFNVVAVDDDGRITAVYCAERPNGSGFWFDIKPGGIESSMKRRGRVLHFARPEDKMRYRFTLSGDDTLTFRYTRKGKHSALEMSRREPSGCAARITAPND